MQFVICFKSNTRKVAGLYTPLPIPDYHGSKSTSTLYPSCWRIKNIQW